MSIKNPVNLCLLAEIRDFMRRLRYSLYSYRNAWAGWVRAARQAG